MFPADWAIVIGVALIAAVDVLLIVYRTPTISRRFRAIGYRLSFMPYAWGVFGGHFWGPHMDPIFGSWLISVGLLLGIGLSLSAFHHGMLRWVDPPDWVALLYLPCGVVAGVVLWPQ